MRQYPLENNLIVRGLNLALSLQRTETPEALALISDEINEYRKRLNDLKPFFSPSASLAENEKPSTQQTSLFIFEFTILKFLNVIAARKARHFKLPHDQEEITKNLKFLSTIPKSTLAGNALLKVMRIILAISAMIMSFDETELAEDITDRQELSVALEIMRQLYALKTDYASIKFEEMLGITPEYCDDLITGFHSITQGLIIKDHAPQTEIEEYTHSLLNIFLNKLLQLRQEIERRELNLVKSVRHVAALTEAELAALQSMKDQIACIDAIMYGLNLHEQPTIRTLLQRHISITQASMPHYLEKNMHWDYRRKSVISGLIDNTATRKIIAQFDQAVSFLFAHIEGIEALIFPLRVLDTYEKNRGEDIFDHNKFQNAADGQIRNLQFDVNLLASQIEALTQEIPALGGISKRLKMIEKLCDAYFFLVAKNKETLEKISENFVNTSAEIIEPDYLISDKLVNAVGRLLQMKNQEMMKRAGDSAVSRTKAIIAGVKDIETLQSKLEKSDRNTKCHALLRTLILDAYLNLLLLCKDSSEMNCLNQNDLKSKIMKLVEEDSSQKAYAFLFDYLPRLIAKGREPKKIQLMSDKDIEKSVLLGYFTKCEGIIAALEKRGCSVGGLTEGIFLISAANVGQCLAHYGNILESQKGGLLTLHLRRYHLDLDKYVSETFCKILPQYLQYRYASLTEDVSEQVACTYPDEKSLLTKIFELGVNAIKAQSKEEIDELENILKTARERMQVLTIEIEDAHGADAPITAHPQVDLFATENNCLALLSILIIRKKQALGLAVSEEDLSQSRSHLEDLKQLAGGAGIHASGIAAVLCFYIQITACVITLLDASFDAENAEHRSDVTERSRLIFDSLLAIQYATKTDLRCQYNQHISVDFFYGLVEGQATVLTPDKAPQSAVQIFLCHHIKLFIDKLIELRKKNRSIGS